MKFSLQEWRRMYDKTHELGKKLKDSRPTYTESMDYIPPLTYLSKDEQLELESQIKTWTQRSNRYLDQCGLRMPNPLWHYSKQDRKTWSSHESFKFDHLLEF